MHTLGLRWFQAQSFIGQLDAFALDFQNNRVSLPVTLVNAEASITLV